MMEAEVSAKLNAAKSERSDDRSGYPFRLSTTPPGYQARYDIPDGSQDSPGRLYSILCHGYKRSEAALVQVVQEAYINGVLTRKIDRLAKKLGIDSISKSQVSEMTKGLNKQVDQFRNRPLESGCYPILWTDALYEDVRIDGHVVSEAIIVVCGVDEHGKRDILAALQGSLYGEHPGAYTAEAEEHFCF